jgi:hypothetical protein
MARFKVRKLFRNLLKSAFPNLFWSEVVDIKDTYLSDKPLSRQQGTASVSGAGTD